MSWTLFSALKSQGDSRQAFVIRPTCKHILEERQSALSWPDHTLPGKAADCQAGWGLRMCQNYPCSTDCSVYLQIQSRRSCI